MFFKEMRIMKTFLMSLLAMMVSLVANAQQTTPRFTVTVGDTSDRSCIPIEISLDNSDVILGIGGYIIHPEGTHFIDPNAPGTGEIGYTKDDSRCEEDHQVDFMSDSDTGKGFFFAFFSRQFTPFKGNSGRIITFYLDCSELIEGEEYALATKLEAVGTSFSAYFAQRQLVPLLDLEDDPNAPKVSITTDANGTGTFTCDEGALNFKKSDLKAYVATKVDNEYVYLSEVTKVPMGTGFMVKGKPNTTYEVSTTMAEVTLPYKDIYLYQYPGSVMENDLVFGYSEEDGIFHRLAPWMETEWSKSYVVFNSALEWGYDEEQGMNVITSNTSGITAETLKPLFIGSGDADGDGIVTMADANMIARKYLGENPEGMVMEAADVNGDGKITIADANAVINLIRK